MALGLSLYLDLVRFILALIVWLGHASFHGYSGKGYRFWFLYDYGRPAVLCFFVLSGFVIAYITERREREPADYAVARLSRLWSVVIPALALTALTDWIGEHVEPRFHGPGTLADGQPVRYAASLLMINDFWLFSEPMAPSTNPVFWSLSYEAVYYAVFGLFLTGRTSLWLVGGALIFILAGPTIFALFPTWLAGLAAYRIARRWTLPPVVSTVLLVGSAALISYTGWLYHGYDHTAGPRYTIDYAIAALLVVHFIAASNLAPFLARVLAPVSGLVRWLGSLTFVIYLCHVPLMQLFTMARLASPGTGLQHLWLFGSSFGAIALITAATAWGQAWLRRILRPLLAPLQANVTIARTAYQPRSADPSG
jgi:peptidoglycan/LPS O-acetylase OafA/YrhL